MDKIKAKVVGPLEIAGVGTGGTTELDPAEVDIDALVAGGHIELPRSARKSEQAAG